ncbi:MAG TPA: outer membrane lipid asymmetry maintenance protein MlaD [Rhodanobacteraceae bacterium]|nr:outer membrane lipid asymmetry maintenance protein MlaD [Rhodanobacteraceae bacterium]
MRNDSRRSYAVGAGLFIVLGFAALAYLATQTTSLANYRQGDTYDVIARFSNIGQLKPRAPVKVAGVRVGSVNSIELDPQTLRAKVTLAIDTRFDQIPDDSAAAIFTSGLLGDQYVGLEPGGSPVMLKDGDQMILTQSAMRLEDLIGKFLVQGSPKDKKDDKNSSGN